MKRNALAFLGVKPEEQGQVWLMLATGFFMGIFIATYQVTAESLFLNKLSDKLDQAFLVSGVLGIISTIVFTFFQNRLKFVTLTISSIALIILATLSIYYFYHFTDEGVQNITLFVMYCLVGPITAILLLCYWGIFGRLFNFKQSKRIIGWIDTGQLIAIILANFLIPATAAFFPDTSNYLIVCNISIAGSLICLILIATNYTLARINTDATVRAETRFSKILGNRYIRLLSIFLIVSMVTLSFNQFTFQTLLNKQYPDQRDLTDFLAYFNGAIYALSLLMQLFVNDRILGTYGIRISLFVLPVVVALLSIGSILAGIFLGYDSALSPQTYIYFFLFVAVTRLFNSMIKDSLESPIYKLLFIPLDNRFRFSIQAKVEGVVNESGRFLAGLFIFLFTLVPFFKIIWIPIVVLGLILAYYKVIQNLYAEYKEKIKSKLEHGGEGQERLEVGYKEITTRLESNLLQEDSSKAVFSFKLLEKIEPGKVGVWVNALMKNPKDTTKEFAQRKMNELKGLSVSENYVIRVDKDKATSDKNLLSRNELDMILNSGGDIQKARILRLARSTDTNDRHYCAELLLHSQNRENISFLIELLSDTNYKVRSAAIKTAIKRNDNEVIAALIENLSQSEYANEAMKALILIGEAALPLLDNAFYRPGQVSTVMLKLVQIIGVIGGNRAKEMLWNKIDYPDKVVVSQVLLALGESGFKAGMSQISRIKYAIESDIGAIAWNLGALTEIGDSEHTRVVRRALHREIQNDIEHIYMLLAMLYDTRSIQLVKENIDSGTAEGITYAVELLDVFLSEQLKMRVIPVLDDLSVSEKIKRLEIFYPRVSLDEKLVLKFLINRDFTQSNRWTKAAVLHQIGEQRIADFNLDLIAQLFNPDLLIRETAAWALHQISPELYTTHVSRLGSEVKRMLDKTVLATDVSPMLFDKILFFQQTELFEDVPGILLSYLADVTKTVIFQPGKTLLVDESNTTDFFIVYQGEVDYYDRANKVTSYLPGQFVGERLAYPGYINSHSLKAVKPSVILTINKEQFYELLAEHVAMADKFLEYVG
ncbi:MAG: HEAT repeat domain-containing protein [Cyclobacteriaceae bacterium]|nr:HEAT repeat domain-containing protein [Cyclobacteriaceae bacterium]